MEQPKPRRRPVDFPVRVPPEWLAGAYANYLNVWHTEFEFTLDFAVMDRTVQPVEPEDPDSPFEIPCHVVARVKIPPTLVFDVLQALNKNMTNYERTFGEIPRPELPQGDLDEP